MYRVLVVEDQTDFYDNYLLRVFDKLLPMELLEITHAPTIHSALQLLTEPWNMILMDFALGSKVNLAGDPIRSGADLVKYRRVLETQMQGLDETFILGIASSTAANRLMESQGAHSSLLKIDVQKMAELVKTVLKVGS